MNKGDVECWKAQVHQDTIREIKSAMQRQAEIADGRDTHNSRCHAALRADLNEVRARLGLPPTPDIVSPKFYEHLYCPCCGARRDKP